MGVEANIGVSGAADDDTDDGTLEYPPRKYLRLSNGSEGG